MQNLEQAVNYRPDIDGLRAVAVLGVVFCHTGIALPGGYVGVDVFFVISGYLIASLLLKDLHEGTFSLAKFWERRIRRIVPALFVVIVASVVFGWFLLAPEEYKMFGRSVVSLTYLRSNDFFSRHSGYFDTALERQSLLHTWSLSIEEQFYLLIPLLFCAGIRARRESWLRWLVTLLTLVSFGWSVYGVTMWRDQAYFALSARAWELFAGVLTAMCSRSMPRIEVPAKTREFAAVLGLLAIILPCLLYDAQTQFPGVAALPPVLGTVLLIIVGHTEPITWAHRLLASRPAVCIGLISYSLYLWHWPLIVFLRNASDWCDIAIMARRIVAITASIALAIVSYYCVERPFRRSGLIATRPRLIFATASVFACMLTAGLSLQWTDGFKDRLPQQAQLFLQTRPSLEWNSGHYEGRDHYQGRDVPHKLAWLGDKDAKPTLLVWGDSHASVVVPMIDELCREVGVAGRTADVAGRPPVFSHCTQSKAHDVAVANDFGTAVLQYAKTDEVDTVLLAGFWSKYFAEPKFADSLLQTIDELRSAGRQVYFMKDVPDFKFDVGASLIGRAWHGADTSNHSITVEEYNAQSRYLDSFLPLLLERGVKVLDPIPYLLDKASPRGFPAFDTGGLLYRDANHLSAHGARTIRPMFSRMIDEMMRTNAISKRMNPSTPTLTTERAQETSRRR